MNEQELIENLCRSIASHIGGANVPLDQRPWSAEQCADYLQIETKTFQNTYAPMPSFPRAIRPTTSAGRGHPRWIAQEVIDWWLSHRNETETRRRRKSA